MSHLSNLPMLSNLTIDMITEIKTKYCDSLKKLNDRIANLSKENLTYYDIFQYNLIEESKDALELCIFRMQLLHPNEEIRNKCVEALKEVSNWNIEQNMRKEVYEIINHYYQNQYETEKTTLSEEQKKYVEKEMFEYEKLGLNLLNDKYDQVKDINKQISINGSNFKSNIANIKTEIFLKLSDLEGLDADWLKNRYDETTDSYKIKLQYIDYGPIMDYCKIRETRKKMSELWGSRCIDTNLSILENTVKLRKERAEIFGYSCHSDFKLQKTMANDSKTVNNFLYNLLNELKPLAKSDIQILSDLAKNMDNIDSIQTYDTAYYSRIYVEKESNLEIKELQKLFTIKSVTDGIFKIYQHLLGLKFVNITEDHLLAMYHSDVQLYCVYNESDVECNNPIAYFYLDLFPREGKYSHAAMFQFVSKSEYNLPISGIICNFDPKLNIEFEYVVTYFHEFGHLMHSLCSTNTIGSLGGCNVQMDFLETPSQMFEEWCYALEPLKELVIPEYINEINVDLINKINKQNKLMQGIYNARQVSLCLLDMKVHSENIPKDTWTFYNELYIELFGFGINPNVNILANFCHMFGYDSSYYGYLWSKVYSIDLFSFFSKGNELNKNLGRKLREKILSQGGTKNGFELLTDFMGREPNLNAFIDSLKI